MPASVSTPSTSTHSRRTLRARSDTVTGLHSKLPIERLSWQQGVRVDLDGCHAADQALEMIGWNTIARTLGAQHLRFQDGANRNVFGGDHALAQACANGQLRVSDGFVRGAQRHCNVADVAHEFLKTDRLQ